MRTQFARVAAIALAGSICAVPAIVLAETDLQPSETYRLDHEHMKEGDRPHITSVVILPQTDPTDPDAFGGDRERMQAVLAAAIDGMETGGKVGEYACMAGLCSVIPQLQSVALLGGAIAGAAAAQRKREIRQFKDSLTDDLTDPISPALRNDVLARDVYGNLRHVPSLESNVIAVTTPIPDDANGAIVVNLTSLTINVDGNTATITTTADVSLVKLANSQAIYQNNYSYQDSDTLDSWLEDDRALWKNYLQFARHYFAREMSADMFEKLELRHTLHPIKTKSVKGVSEKDWDGTTKSANPTLAWELTLLGGDTYGDWAKNIPAEKITFDLEMYDQYRPVYAARRLTESRYDVPVTLEKCKTYWWTVRPNYDLASKQRAGEWMRRYDNLEMTTGRVGEKASEEPAFLMGFAKITTSCRG